MKTLLGVLFLVFSMHSWAGDLSSKWGDESEEDYTTTEELDGSFEAEEVPNERTIRLNDVALEEIEKAYRELSKDTSEEGWQKLYLSHVGDPETARRLLTDGKAKVERELKFTKANAHAKSALNEGKLKKLLWAHEIALKLFPV